MRFGVVCSTCGNCMVPALGLWYFLNVMRNGLVHFAFHPMLRPPPSKILVEDCLGMEIHCIVSSSV